MKLGRIGTRAAAAVAMMLAAAVLVPAGQAPAQAAPKSPAAWTPQIYPLLSGESVDRNISSANRNAALAICAYANGIACVSVGQGDGMHSVFHLYKCDTRSLSNFVDALAVKNHQTGGAQVHFWGPRYSALIPADNVITTVPDYATYDFNRLKIC